MNAECGIVDQRHVVLWYVYRNVDLLFDLISIPHASSVVGFYLFRNLCKGGKYQQEFQHKVSLARYLRDCYLNLYG